MKLYDAHTHLNTTPLVEDRQGYIQQFIEVGGVGLVNSGADEQYNLKGIEIAKKAQSLKLKAQGQNSPLLIVKTTLGWHPLECVEGVITSHNMSEKIQWLKHLYLTNKKYAVGIGETGLDLHYPNGIETLDIQKQLFVAHCEMAREFDLPLIVHSRDAFEDTFEILQHYTDLTVYFHCRGYGPQEIETLKSLKIEKLYFGFCGNVTYKKAEALRESLKIVPLHQLLLETDAPYLTPQVVRGQDNHPAFIRYLYDFVAAYLQIDPLLLSECIEANFREVYKL